MKKRAYTKRRRARQEATTRQRIVEAASELHEELGPRETTIRAVAERAGVQRLTVYRHFPDDFALFEACAAHWLESHPPPEPHQWSGADSPEEITRLALLALYGYYRRTAPMWAARYRDVDLVPALERPLADFHSYLDGIRNQLMKDWYVEGARRRRVRAALGHLLQFSSWRSLKGEGLRDPEMSRTGASWIRALAEEPAGRQRRRKARQQPR